MPERFLGRYDLIAVGDLHGAFDDVDAAFLAGVPRGRLFFVGDLGDEDPEIVARVAALPPEPLVLLGNHDAWESFRLGRPTAALKRSLEILGPRHHAYGRRALAGTPFEVLGARPFSWGGPTLRSERLYEELYGVDSIKASARKILAAAGGSRSRRLIVLAHNGPRGLGRRPDSIFGKDFGRPGGDWGDADLQAALKLLRAESFEVPLVIAGHMHHRLLHPKGRTRVRCVAKEGTLYVNTARVPRIFPGPRGRTLHHAVGFRFGAAGPSAADIFYDREGLVSEQPLSPL